MNTAAIKNTFLLLLSLNIGLNNYGQTIGTFNSVQPAAQTQYLVLPSSHKFQRIIKTGDALSAGGTLGGSLDFTGYVPISGSSTNGYLSISSETYPAEVAVLNIAFNGTTKTWATTSGGKVDFPQADIGAVRAFCSGAVTPRNTVLVCEENDFSPFESNGDGYEDFGWVVEIDPATRKVVNQDGVGGVDKLWAMGRNRHENVALKSDETVAYWAGDDANNGFVYKFVPTVPGNYSSGNLYVLQTTAALGTGTWQLIPNTTISERNNTVALSHTAGGYNFDRVEDMEIGGDGKVYFAVTSSGNILRFRDLGNSVDELEVFVANTAYDVDGAGPFTWEPWGTGADNLAFDGEGNLWVLQDGGRNHIWVVGPTHSAATPAVRLFATTPDGCEPTGITFSPDYKYLFMSIMHPNASNTATQTDAAGAEVIFNTHTTIVISRAENLGVGTVLPVRFLNFDVQQNNNKAVLKWTIAGAQQHNYFVIERSVDGVNFTSIGENREGATGNQTYTFTDDAVIEGRIYYMIKQCDRDGSCSYSAVKSLDVKGGRLITLYPIPATTVIMANYYSQNSGAVVITIYNKLGQPVHRETKNVIVGMNNIEVNTSKLSKGTYLFKISDDVLEYALPFIKK